jgi:hypothetical protein
VHATSARAGKENAEAGLPPGWAAVWSTSRSVWYWRDANNGEVAWEKPLRKAGVLDAPDDAADAAEAMAKADLPPGWSATFSRSKQQWYWRGADGSTTWMKPSLA